MVFKWCDNWMKTLRRKRGRVGWRKELSKDVVSTLSLAFVWSLRKLWRLNYTTDVTMLWIKRVGRLHPCIRQLLAMGCPWKKGHNLLEKMTPIGPGQFSKEGTIINYYQSTLTAAGDAFSSDVWWKVGFRAPSGNFNFLVEVELKVNFFFESSSRESLTWEAPSPFSKGF